MADKYPFYRMPVHGATLSGDQRYRYVLWRSWSDAPRILYVGLNPSTADALTDDPTIRRMVGFAKRDGHGGIFVCNLFALRATDPRELRRTADPVGPRNKATLREYGEHAHLVVCCWGCHGTFRHQDRMILTLLRDLFGHKLYCLGTTKAGHPKHPLYLSGAAQLVPFGGHR